VGVRWNDGAATLDVDFAHAGKNISVALPADLRIDVHSALESLEMGLLPIAQFMPCAGEIVRFDCPQRAHCRVANCLRENNHVAQFAPCIASRWEQSNPDNFPRARHNGKAGTQYRNPADQELRLDFVTSATRSGKPVNMPELNLALEPLKFMEFSLQDTTQGCVISRMGACVVNLPAPERYAVHKLIVFGERPITERTKSTKDLLQAASLIDYFANTGQSNIFNAAWQDALSRGKGWRSRAVQGMEALLRLAPGMDMPMLWK